MKSYWMMLAVVMTTVSCSQVLGLKEPSLESADPDASVDAAPDAAPPALWIFTTNAQFNGGFGTGGARAIADAKCDDMSRFAYQNRGCTKVHAVLQVDSDVDTLARMATTYGIPATSPVQRASDGAQVAAKWADVVDPNKQLQAEVTPSANPVYFWSGRGLVMDQNCTGWSLNGNAFFGDIGDATKRNSWTSTASVRCDDLNQHLLCVCW